MESRFNDVKADQIIPSHWGTIVLTDESPWEPPERYRAFAVENDNTSFLSIPVSIIWPEPLFFTWFRHWHHSPAMLTVQIRFSKNALKL